MDNKPSRPGRRKVAPNQTSQLSQITRPVGLNIRQIWLICQQETLFALQLLLIFSVSFTSVQVTRSWLSAQHSPTSKPMVYSARLFRPIQAPLPAVVNHAGPAHAGLQAAQAWRKALPLTDTPVQLASMPFKAHAKATTQPMTRVSPARRQAVKVAQTHVARSVFSRAQRVPSYRQARISSPSATVKRKAAMAPIKQILLEQYQVSKLESYQSYMTWARKTLKAYQNG